MSIPLLVGVAVLWLLVMVKMNNDITKTTAELETAKQQADAVRKLQDETKAKQAELDPIQAKVKFVQDADLSGLPFFDRFHKINQYIYDKAIVRSFSITPPGAVSFSVELANTEDAGRFILNLIRCPYITGISISGSPGVGGTIAGEGGAAAPAAAGGAGAPGMPPGGPEMPGAPPGAAGPAPGAPAGGAPAAGAVAGPIQLSVTATLVESITIPTPPSGAPAAAGPEGAGGPGGPPGGPGGAPPGGPPSGPSDGGGGDDGGGKAKGGGGDEA
jgi:uncharacterized membrane protein YgcG